MEPLPKKTTLAHETAAVLKQWISTGVIREIVPGEMELKKRLVVSRETVRGALKLLEHEKWITPSTKGQQRRIKSIIPLSPEIHLRNQLPLTFLSPDKVVHRITLLELEETRLRLARQGREIRFVSPNIFHLQRPEHHLERLVRSNPSSAWILWIVSEPIQRWFDKQEIPTFLIGSPFPRVSLPFIVNDWGPAAFHAGLQLLRHGHRHVAIMEYQERFPGLVAEEQGLATALTAGDANGRMMAVFDNGTPASVAQALENIFSQKDRPTALVLTRVAQVLTCFSWLGARGIRIPADISIVSLANDSCFDDFFPVLSHYRSNTKLISRSIAERVMELVERGRTAKKSLRIPLEYVPGSTIGPAPAN
ncbi:MAG: substrate-binding domain-containing protein [Verrucomicrobiota bacterium]